ncbi:N-acetylmuramic acid 6-phosphate etherase [Bacillus sp. 1P06AnD]|uniref:N-acetylmuramic acid 6-phosphate etherase n=1 Tax=Bacillus sp. 1P06AnD TaxID=3132208 RepID=UPI00399F6E4E
MLENLTTEQRNNKSMQLDSMDIIDVLKTMNEEDMSVAQSVQNELPQIAQAIKLVISSLKAGGRLIYFGAGTSGRIGLLDAVECPPTFNTDSTTVLGLIAGGQNAFMKAVEGAEDSTELATIDLKDIVLNDKDVVIGIAASGRTPYVIAGLEYANQIGAQTISISCNKDSKIGKVAKVAIEVATGAEVLTGSTRLKAGTAQKMVCNMISTVSMIGLGKVYGNLMVDLQLTNEKLVERAKKIVMDATGCSYEVAEEYLVKSNQQPKTAIVMILTDLTYEEAMQRLKKSDGFIKGAL